MVIAIIGILAGLLLPTLGRAKEKARSILCLNNKKQLGLAWMMYPGDFEDKLVPHGLNIPSPPKPELGLWWAQGFLNYDGGNSENTNIALLLDPHYAKLGPYTDAAAIYKCPSDRSKVLVGRNRFQPRIRSISAPRTTPTSAGSRPAPNSITEFPPVVGPRVRPKTRCL